MKKERNTNFEEVIKNVYKKKEYKGQRARCLSEREINYDLTFIVPCYNAQSCIERCVDSIIYQKSKYKIEIILVDDGSKDNTFSIIKKYKQNYNFIKILSQSNMGISGARNAGLKLSTGRYIAFVDNDDYIAPEFTQCLLDKAYETNADVVKCGHYEINNSNIKQYNYENMHTNYLGADIVKYSGYIWEGIVHRSIWEQVCFPESYWYEDMISKLLVYRLSKNFVSVNDILYYHIYHQNNASTKLWNNKNFQCIDQLYLPWELKLYGDKIGICDEIGLSKVIIKEYGELLYTRTIRLPWKLRQAVFLQASSFLKSINIEGTFTWNERWLIKAFSRNSFIYWIVVNKITLFIKRIFI